MKYLKFIIEGYRGISEPLTIDLRDKPLIPIVGINECGKTTILQAIYCFDHVNDGEYDGKHITNTLNLYKTSDENPPLITADISMTKKELEGMILSHNAAEDGKEEAIESGTEYESNLIDLSLCEYVKNSPVRIQRNLQTLSYSIINEELEAISFMAKSVVRRTPYILYNDDFMDRPPNEIDIPDEMPNNLSGWPAIYERLFNTTDSNYSLFSIMHEEDERRRQSIKSDVEEVLNKKLSKAWKTFLLSNHGALYVQLDINVNSDPKKLEIKIIEKIGKKVRYFDVADRSKGFLWFFNFVMKLEFNPKVIGESKDTIFLLDEPGSYLHSSAQEKLCHKLKDISMHNGNVIFCTHSHHLLNPEVIPLNRVYIVEKERNKNVKATLLPQVKLKKENINAYQPIFDALQIPSYNLFNNTKPIIAVEGIYDKYSILLFCDTSEEVNILPGTSADSIVKNIQYLNGFVRPYIAIWDNDAEGRDKYDKACKLFGEHEAQKFDKLPLRGKRNRKMEKMFEDNDLIKIQKYLKLSTDAGYEKIISTLFFSNKPTKNKVRDLLSSDTKKNFEILSSVINKRIVSAKKSEPIG